MERGKCVEMGERVWGRAFSQLKHNSLLDTIFTYIIHTPPSKKNIKKAQKKEEKFGFPKTPSYLYSIVKINTPKPQQHVKISNQVYF
jgi:hypothetical protein